MYLTRIDEHALPAGSTGGNRAEPLLELVADPGVGPDRPVRVDWFDTETAAKNARYDIQMQKAMLGGTGLLGAGS